MAGLDGASYMFPGPSADAEERRRLQAESHGAVRVEVQARRVLEPLQQRLKDADELRALTEKYLASQGNHPQRSSGYWDEKKNRELLARKLREYREKYPDDA